MDLDAEAAALLAAGRGIVLQVWTEPPPRGLVTPTAVPLPEPVYCPVCQAVRIPAGDAVRVLCSHWDQPAPDTCGYCHGRGGFYLRWLPPTLCERCDAEGAG